jgi:5'-deoxynucleotidase YfbR-like HD superfamily hydrolase
MSDSKLAWIETFTGKRFYLLEPRMEDVDIIDIAHSLSMQCRWTGHCKYHYSVAQHSYYCSLLGPKEDALQRLLHDASEAYIADMNRPLKHYTEAGEAYRRVEKPLQKLIYNAFGVSEVEAASVHRADNQMLYTEKGQLMTLVEWDVDWTGGQGAENLGSSSIVIEKMYPEIAEKLFLNRFQDLYTRRII